MHVKTVYWGHLLVFQMSIRWRRLLGFNYDYFSPFPIILFTRSQIYCYELCWILNFYTNRICLDIKMHPNSYLGCFSLNQMFEGESALGTRLRCIINCQFKNFGRHWFDSRKYVCVRRLTVASLHQGSDFRVNCIPAFLLSFRCAVLFGFTLSSNTKPGPYLSELLVPFMFFPIHYFPLKCRASNSFRIYFFTSN